MKRILLALGILNILEGIRVLFQKIPAMLIRYPVDPVTHSIFHMIIGLLIMYIGIKGSLLTRNYFMFSLAALGVLFIGYSVVIFSMEQEAEKFGYLIIYPLHAAYYFMVGFCLLIFYRLIKANRKAVKEQRPVRTGKPSA